jgi:hypothetical protein
VAGAGVVKAGLGCSGLRPAGRSYVQCSCKSGQTSTAARPPCFVAIRFRGGELAALIASWIGSSRNMMPIPKSVESISHGTAAATAWPIEHAERISSHKREREQQPTGNRPSVRLGRRWHDWWHRWLGGLQQQQRATSVTHDGSRQDRWRCLFRAHVNSIVPSRTQLSKREWETGSDRSTDGTPRMHGWSSWTGRA